MKRLRNSTLGAALLEYAMLIALILLIAIGAILALGHKINWVFGSVASTLASHMHEDEKPAEDSGEDEDGEDEGGDEGEGEPEVVCTGDCTYVGLSNGDVMKLGDDGTPVWTKTLSAAVPALTVGPQGFLYAGTSDGNIYKLDADGNILWENSISGAYVTKVAVSKDGHLYFTDTMPSVHRLNKDTGALSGLAMISNTSGYTSESARDMAVDASGNVYLALAYGDFIKYTPDLSQIWRVSSGLQYLDGIAVDLDNNLFIAGMTFKGSEADLYTSEEGRHYIQNGNVLTLNNRFKTNGQVDAMDIGPDGKLAMSSYDFSTKANLLIGYEPLRYPNWMTEHPSWDYYKEWKNTNVGVNVTDIEYDRNGFVWVASKDKSVRKIDKETGLESARYDFASAVHAVAIAPGRYGTGY